jgi:hypothetical protein
VAVHVAKQTTFFAMVPTPGHAAYSRTTHVTLQLLLHARWPGALCELIVYLVSGSRSVLSFHTALSLSCSSGESTSAHNQCTSSRLTGFRPAVSQP